MDASLQKFRFSNIDYAPLCIFEEIYSGFIGHILKLGIEQHIIIFGRVDPDSMGRLKPTENEEDYHQKVKERETSNPLKNVTRKFCDWFAVITSSPPYSDWNIEPIRLWLKGPRVIQYKDGYLAVKW